MIPISALRALLRAGLSVALALVAAPRGASAQTAPEQPARTRVWLDAGFTVGAGGGVESGLGWIAQLNYQKRSRFWALRFAGLAEFEGFPDSGGDGGAGEFGVLYGRSRVWSWAEATVAAGLALTGIDKGGGPANGSSTSFTVGVPLTARISAQTPVLGVGTELWMNVNPKAPFGGVSFFLQLGWMP